MNIVYSLRLPKLVRKTAARIITLSVDGVEQEPTSRILNMLATESQEFKSPQRSTVSATMVDFDDYGNEIESYNSVEVVLTDLVSLNDATIDVDEVGVEDVNFEEYPVDEDNNTEDKITSEDRKLVFKFIRIEE